MEALVAIRTKAVRLAETAHKLEHDLRNQYKYEDTSLSSSYERRLKRVVERYGELRSWIMHKFYEVGMQMPYVTLPDYVRVGDALGILEDIVTGCKVVEKSVEMMIKPSIEPKLVDKLGSLGEELEKLESEGLDVMIVKNLKEAIMEAEHGHRLASAMIASRIIRNLIDRLEGEKDEDKVDYLVRVGAVPRDRKDLQRQILTAMRLSRNFLAHRVDIFPETSNVLTLLGGAFNLSKIWLELSKQ